MGQLGDKTPNSILQTLWFYTTVHFGLRGCVEHRDMCWGDVVLISDEHGHESLEFSERQTKTKTGENIRDVRAVKPKLSNHSARKFLIQKLNDCNVSSNRIMQISGHKKVASINNYSHLNPHQHKDISRMLHNRSNVLAPVVQTQCQ